LVGVLPFGPWITNEPERMHVTVSQPFIYNEWAREHALQKQEDCASSEDGDLVSCRYVVLVESHNCILVPIRMRMTACIYEIVDGHVLPSWKIVQDQMRMTVYT
jgi:hypothetical protein